MRVSVEIDEATLNALRRLTGETKMSRPSVARSPSSSDLREFGRLLREDAFDYPLTNDQVESADH